MQIHYLRRHKKLDRVVRANFAALSQSLMKQRSAPPGGDDVVLIATHYNGPQKAVKLYKLR